MKFGFVTPDEAKLIEDKKLPQEQRVAWPPDSTILYGLDENDEVMARMGLVILPHIEGTWIREDRRNGLTATRLISQMEKFLIETQRRGAFSFVEDSNDEVKSYMERLGYSELPLKVYFKSLVEEKKVE
jgi:hypothetical protein